MDRAVRTYADLSRFAQGFASGKLPLLVVHGGQGTGKTSTMRAALPNATVIGGHASAMALYEQAYLADDGPILLDDVDSLLTQPAATAVLKNLCQSEPSRTVTWMTTSKYLDEREIPREFTTRSPVCILANKWDARNPNVRALGDRGFVLRFEPSVQEIHEAAGAWVEDREVYDHVGGLLPRITRLSMRDYRNAMAEKEFGGDWRAGLDQSLQAQDPLSVVKRLLGDKGHASEADRVAAFRAATGKGQATYYRLRRQLSPP